MKKYIAPICISIMIVGCSNNDPSASLASFMSKESQLQTRQYQVKSFRTTKDTLMKVAISTLQDDNYIIHHSDNNLGLISASKKDANSVSQISMHIQEIDQTEAKIRMNIEMSSENFFGSTKANDVDKIYYHYVFDRVGKSLFLEETLSSKKNNKDKLDLSNGKITADPYVKSVLPQTMVEAQPQINQEFAKVPTIPMQTQVIKNTVPEVVHMPPTGFSGSILTPEAQKMYTQQSPQQAQQPTQKQQDTKRQKKVVTRDNNFVSNDVQPTNIQPMQPIQNQQMQPMQPMQNQQMQQQYVQPNMQNQGGYQQPVTIAPNPNAAVQYNFNPQTQKYDYYKGN